MHPMVSDLACKFHIPPPPSLPLPLLTLFLSLLLPQIMDDVLNLRGIFSGAADKTAGAQLKTLGEDITAGKVTFPVVKAMTRLPRAAFAALWAGVSARPGDAATVAALTRELEECGAIDACVVHADKLVTGAYAALDAAVPDSFAKVMLHAFGYFITQHSGG